MLKLDKYNGQETDLTYSEEGFIGGLVGFILGGAFSLLPGAGAGLGAAAEASVQKIRQDINDISARIVKIRNGEIDDAVKQGTKLPAKLKHINNKDVIVAALMGQIFGPFYGAYKGSQLQNENDKLQDKIRELEKELTKLGIEP